LFSWPWAVQNCFFYCVASSVPGRNLKWRAKTGVVSLEWYTPCSLSPSRSSHSAYVSADSLRSRRPSGLWLAGPMYCPDIHQGLAGCQCAHIAGFLFVCVGNALTARVSRAINKPPVRPDRLTVLSVCLYAWSETWKHRRAMPRLMP